ncbi:MAG: hypothetical protein ACQ5SW_06365 [Sphaerochaetaceae bacterium]
MKTILTAWKDQILSQKEDTDTIALTLQKQAQLQQELSESMDPQEAILLSLYRMNAHFSLQDNPQKKAVPKLFITLLVLQLIFSQIPSFLGYPLDTQTSLYYGLNLPLLIVLFLTLFLVKDRRWLIGSLLFLFILALLMNFQFSLTGTNQTQTKVLAIIHLPLLLVVSLALPTQKGSPQERISSHIQLVGEVLLLMFIFACAVFTIMILTIVLFEAVGIKLENRLVPFTLTGIIPLLPLSGYYLLHHRGAKMTSIIRLLATIFLPVMTVIMLSFLTALVIGRLSITEDRNLLLFIDLLLALVLLMILHGTDLLETGSSSAFYRTMIITGALTAMIIDLFALAAIGSRFLQYGLSPNRLAVLAENLLLFGNLLALVVTLLRRKSFLRIQSLFMAAYGIWFFFVIMLFGPLFKYL